MSRNIEENVVQMTFDNSNFEKNCSTTMSTLDKLKAALNFKNTGEGLDGLASSMKGLPFEFLGNAAETVSTKFKALEVVGVTALVNIANKAINAGEALLKSLTIDPIMGGFQTYETKINSTQTIMAATGESLERVTAALKDLNEYSDKTIYSFSDMTKNIGKFTNAGISLDDAVAAMKGISNEAALAGAETAEASRAMYNIAQAFSVGSMKVIDWKSIENANMATKAFKEELIKTGEALGTLKKQGDYFISTTTNAKGSTSDAFNAIKGFRDSLNANWITNEVMVETLKRFADETSDVGKKSYEAASQVRTFTMMMTVLKEAAKTSWANTWQLVIGDLPSAKKFYTAISQVVLGILGNAEKSRNLLLQGWVDMGGRVHLLQAFSNIWAKMVEIGNNVKTMFNDLFPKTTSPQLNDLTNKFLAFSERVKNSTILFVTFHNVSANILNAISAIKRTVEEAGKAFAPLLDNFDGLFMKILNKFNLLDGRIALLLGSYENMLNNGDVRMFFESIADTIQYLINSVYEAAMNIKPTLERIIGYFVEAKNKVVDFFKMAGIEGAITKLTEFANVLRDKLFANGSNEIVSKDALGNLTLAGKIAEFLAEAMNILFDALEKVATFLSGAFSSILEWTADKLHNIFETIGGATGIIKILTTGALAGGLMGLGKSLEGFTQQIGGVVGRLTAPVDGITAVLNKLSAFFEAGSWDLTADTIKKVAIAVIILAASMFVLASLSPEQLAKAEAAIYGLAQGILVFVKTLTTIKIAKGSLMAVGASMITLSLGILILAAACKVLGGMDTMELAQGLGALAVMFMVIQAFFTNMNSLTVNPKTLTALGTAMISIAAAMILFAGAVLLFGLIPFERLLIGMGAMALILLEISLFAESLKDNAKDMLIASPAIIVIAASLFAFAAAIALLGALPIEVLAKGLITLGVVLFGLGDLLVVLANLGPQGAASALVASIAIGILAVSMLALAAAIAAVGALPGKTLIKGLGTLVLALAALIAAGAIAMPAAVGILALAGAILAIGIAVATLGVGIAALGVGLSLLAISGPIAIASFVASCETLITAIKLMLEGLVGLIPFFVDLILSFVTDLLHGIAWNVTSWIDDIAKILGKLLEVVLDLLVKYAPDLIDTVLYLLSYLMGALEAYVPHILEKAVELIVELLEVLAEHLPDFIAAGVDLILAFLQGINDAYDTLLQATWDLMINLINGMADSIEQNAPLLAEAVFNLLKAIVKGIFAIITGNKKELKETVDEFLNSGIVQTIKQKFVDVKDAATGTVTTFKEGILSKIEEIKAAAKDFVDGFVNGIKEKWEDVKAAARELGDKIISPLRNKLDEHSPSKVGIEIGAFFDKGLAIGIQKEAGMVQSESEALGDIMIDTLSDAADRLNSNEFANIRLRPVLDGSNIQNGYSDISRMLNGQSLSVQSSVNMRDEAINSMLANTRDAIYRSNDEVITAVNRLAGSMDRYAAEKPVVDVYMSSKKVASSIVGDVNRELATIQRRGG